MQEKDNLEILIGIYSQGKGDFGFVDIEGQEKGYFVYGKNKAGALDGDKVEAKLKIFKQKKEAIITKILERKTDLIVGEFIDNGTFGFVIPKNKQVGSDIFVNFKNFNNAKTGDIVGVFITKWTKKNPEGIIKEIIGKKTDSEIDLLSLIVEGGARLKFPNKVLNDLKTIDDKIPSYIYQKRKNLNCLFTFTIDGEDAKDLDDAISIEKSGDNYKLYVHIADVSHFVKEKSDLDIEAYKRSTSIYLVDRVIPMLPEKLSNNLCSLNPNIDKLTLSCEILFNNKGEIIDQKVYESIINSDFRLTYSDVDQILNYSSNKKNADSFSGEGVPSLGQDRGPDFSNNKLFFGGEITQKLIEIIKLSDELKNKIIETKKKSGVLNFDFVESKIILDDNKKFIEIKKYPKYESNKIIEEFMISANQGVSKYFSSIPFLYRIHNEPKLEDISSLQNKLNLFEIDFKFKKADTKEFSQLLEKISKLDNSKKVFIEKIILKTLSKAIYSKENFGHFGLGLNFYSHFTSPIRRYPDLQIHRIIKEKLNKTLDNNRLYHYENILDKVANYTSTRERKAEKLEYKIKDYYIANYYKDKIGEEFTGLISGVISKGIFVSLDNTVEGFVEISNSDFNEDLEQHFDLKTKKIYNLADRVKVKLIDVNLDLLRLNFVLV